MAESIETIITVYKAQVEGYTKEIDAIIKKVRELTGTEDQQTKNAAVGARSLTDSATQRKKLLNDEIANLKKLQEQSKKAFTVPEIQSFNSQIAQSKNNIALLGGETSKLNPITEGLKNQFALLGATILAAFSISAIKNFAVDSVKSFQEAELSAKKLETTIVNIGGEGEIAFKKLISQSKQFQNISIFSDEDIQRSQTQLSQFGLLSNEIEDIIPKILDLASAQGIDLGQATDIVIQGINGVTRGLKPLGLEFQNTGDKAQNFAIITDKLNRFQGQTAAVLETSAGRAKNLGNQFDELKERIGGLIESSGVLKNFTTTFQAFIDSFKTAEERADESVKSILKSFVSALEAEATGLLNAALKQKEAIEVLSDPEKEKFLAETRLKILGDFAARIADTSKEIQKEQAILDKIGVEPKSDANDLLIKQTKERIESLQNEASALQIVIDKRIQSSKPVESNLGITEEEKAKRAAKALEEKNKILAEEKQIQEAINKLTVEVEPDIQKKIAIQKEIDKKLTETVEEDLRTRNQIELDLNKKKNDLLFLQNLKAFQDTAKLNATKSFTEDEKNLTEFVEKRTSEIINSNKTIAERENELTALSRTELEIRLLNAQQFTGDIIEQQKLIFAAQSNLNKFTLDQDKKIADAQLKAAQELQSELDRERVIETGGGIPGLELQKTLATEQAIRELFDAKFIEDAQTRADKEAAIRLGLQNKLAEIDLEISQTQIENFRQTFDTITGFAREFVNIFTELEQAKSDAVIEGLEKQLDEQEAAFDKETDSLQEARDKRLISEKEFEDRSAKLKDQRIASEKKINEAIKAEKRKQAEIAKAVAIFEATLNFAQAIIVALSAAPPPFNVVLAAISAALAGVQLAAVIATPIPTFAKGTKDKKESGMAIVGERGEELVHLPSAAQVLPAPQTKKNREAINAMFDNNFDEYVRKKYVQPEINKEKISVQKKYEILKQVYEKQAVDNYNKSVQEKYELTRTNALNNIVNNYVNNIISNEQTDTKYYNELVNKKNELTQLIKSVKKEDVVTKEKLISEVDVINNKINTVKNSVEDVVKKRTELSQILSQSKISHSFINNEIKKTISSEIKETLLKNIVYNSGFEKSINTNYVSAALEENRAKLESKKQETFAQSIANSFMLSNQTNFDNEKIQIAVENGFRAATKRGVFMRNFEQLAEAMADKIKPDFRKL